MFLSTLQHKFLFN